MKLHPMRSLRLRTVLLIVNLLILVVPLSSLYIFHIYENELIQQTERELIAQGIYIQALYRNAYDAKHAPQTANNSGIVATPTSDNATSTVIDPVLNLSLFPILPARPAAKPSPLSVDNLAKEAAQSIFPVIDAATRKTLAGVRLTDSLGIVVAGREEIGLSLADIPEIQGALSGRYTATLRERISKHPSPALNSLSRGSHIRVFIALPVTKNEQVIGGILLSRTPRNILKALYDNRAVVFMAVAFIFVVTAFIAFLTSYTIGRPILTLTSQAEQITTGGTNINPIAHPVTREIELLSETLATMAKTVASRSDYIRNFAMHVSHEFKTPLTAIQGAIELIGEHGKTMTPGEQQRFVANIISDTDRLKQLMNKLMDLARADVLLVKHETCEAKDILHKLRHDYAAKGLAINFTLPMIPMKLAIAPDIVETSFINLLENSRQHGAKSVHIEIEPSANGRFISLSLHDDGQGISATNVENLFSPFFTTKRDAGGTGLGLAITRSLLSAYMAKIDYRATTVGACFVVTIPSLP